MLNGFCCALDGLAKKMQQNKINYKILEENKNTIWKGLDSIKIEDKKKSNKRSKN